MKIPVCHGTLSKYGFLDPSAFPEAPRCGSGPDCPLEGPPHPHIATGGPFPQVTALPSPPSPALSLPLPPTPPLPLFAMLRDGVAQAGVGEGS